MSMGRTKCKNIITNVLYSVKRERVSDLMRNTKFPIYIDETCDITNEKWLTFFIRYINFETLNVNSQLVKLINIDAKNSSTEKLFEAFRNKMWNLGVPFLNILALSCDNASVMTRNHESFKQKLECMNRNVITFRCPCHSATLVAAHNVCARIPEYCEEFMKKIANFIHNSPK
ncbi:hypothetical protein PV328_001300 [Microctonus aethiopoides]|uniref:DUF4371 domain-containing protein n=1 Tax=Microctonus aethiopoides TaxID=144406 RepID=A0AA39FWP3_9HYME|nr:hypothetical protein PV328_001300 [Microctonus aethiopoides]